MNKTIILLGYTSPKHTNWYPWNRFSKTFSELGMKHVWTEVENFKRVDNENYAFLCWNMPDAHDLVNAGLVTKDDVILQKVTSMTKRDSLVNWGDDPFSFYKSWSWPAYKMCLDILEKGYNLYAFGCKSSYKDFPIKERYVNLLGDRLTWIPWTTCMYNLEDLKKQTPILSGFEYDSAFVGSIWGKNGRGNLESVNNYLYPILQESEEFYIAGMGTQNGPISNEEHIPYLKKSRLCPIINAPSWQAENGVQDRFWTVFASGRFGVVDSEGVYDFFDEKEVICETDPDEYVQKSLYYMKNIEKQLPYIQKIQSRISKEYNWNMNFRKILEKIK